MSFTSGIHFPSRVKNSAVSRHAFSCNRRSSIYVKYIQSASGWDDSKIMQKHASKRRPELKQEDQNFIFKHKTSRRGGNTRGSEREVEEEGGEVTWEEGGEGGENSTLTRVGGWMRETQARHETTRIKLNKHERSKNGRPKQLSGAIDHRR